MEQDESSRTSSVVIGAVAAGVAPLPFLAVYAVLFLVHGFVSPVSPPDVTGSRTGEGLAGLLALALFVIGAVSVGWYLAGRRRWLFVAAQLATLAAAIDFVVDSSTGPAGIPFLLAVTSGLALVLAGWGWSTRDRSR